MNDVLDTIAPVPLIAQVRHASEWTWLDLKGGGALH